MTKHEGLVEEIVLDFFTALSTERTPYGGSQRDYIVESLRERSSEELVSQLSRAAKVVEGFCEAAEAIDPVTLVALDDCRNRVRGAHRRAELVVRDWEMHPDD